jgi:ribosomal protein S18 acetylase RimI-like enzyme
MDVEILPVNRKTLEIYCTIPAHFEVDSFIEVDVIEDGFGGMVFHEEQVSKPYMKYYGENEEPMQWLNFNTDNWVIFLVKQEKKTIGGLTIACKTPEIRMLNGRNDLADVWDIRVHPDYRHSGVGTKLFKNAIVWSKNNDYRQICVETQNVNVKACRFYFKQGCNLGAINRYAYYGTKGLENEVQLIWFKDL